MSETGVMQSLFLASDELRIIREDRWGNEVWGAVEDGDAEGGKDQNRSGPRLYFLFARKDHWVADETREEVLTRRGHGGRHTFLVDEEGLQHAWCLKQNKAVADRVGGWVGEIIKNGT